MTSNERINREKKALVIADAAIRGIRSDAPTGAQIREQAGILAASEGGAALLASKLGWDDVSDETVGLVVTILRRRARYVDAASRLRGAA